MVQKTITKTFPYDVLVLGGGTAGVIAAVQAARAGARTLLVEKNGMLGGTMTLGGVNNPGLFHAWGQQVIAGIGWELVTRTLETSGGSLPDCFDNYHLPHWKHHVRVDRFIYAALCDDAVNDAGADLLLHTMVAAVSPGEDGNGWTVTLCTKTGLVKRTAAVVIDATGDANATALAGFEFTVPLEVQPATLCCRITGYDVAGLDLAAINRAFDAEVQAGRARYTDASWNSGNARVETWLGAHGENASHTCGINAHDSEGKTNLELEARRGVLRLYRFLRQQPGLQNLRIEHLAPECGVRESVTIRGKKTVTATDYVSGKRWDDAICYAFYPIDLHVSDGAGLQKRHLERGVVPTVPRGALLPSGSHNFIVAGRCISSDREANSALRVQATCMAVGQAAGALAALAAHSATDPEKVSNSDLYALLTKHGALVPR